MTKVISVGNFKGGVGKTVISLMFSYVLATKKNKKVLVIDLDPQADVTMKLKRTFGKEDVMPEEELMEAIDKSVESDFQRDISRTIVSVYENLDVVHGSWDFENFPTYIVENIEDSSARFYVLYTLIQPFMGEYDFIIFDTPPSTHLITTNAICASDYALITTETEESSTESTKKLYNYIGSIIEYNENLKLLGVLPFLKDKYNDLMIEFIDNLRKDFETDVFDHISVYTRKIPTWNSTGVTEHKPYDKRALKIFEDIVDEAILRIEQKEGNE